MKRTSEQREHARPRLSRWAAGGVIVVAVIAAGIAIAVLVASHAPREALAARTLTAVLASADRLPAPDPDS